jgi:hypothetical protein
MKSLLDPLFQKLTIFVKHFHLISESFCITYILARTITHAKDQTDVQTDNSETCNVNAYNCPYCE